MTTRRFMHVCFDLDGTLIDSRADLASAMNRVLGDLGREPLPLATLQSFVGEGARRLVERSLGESSTALVAEALDRFLRWYGAHLLDETRLYPEVPEMLAGLADRGIVLTLLTNKPEAMSRTILDGLRVGGRFAAVVGGDSLPVRKPDPAGLDHLLAAVGVPRVASLLVGDSGIDVRTARAAGVEFCGVAWGLTPEGMWAERPERVIDRPTDLLAVVDAA